MAVPNQVDAASRAYARFLPRLRALIVDAIIMLVAIYAAVLVAVAARSDSIARPLGFTVAALWLLYEPLLVAFMGGTLGHRFGNLRVVDDRTGGNVSFLKAVARTIIKALLGIFSFVTVLATRRSQALHDLLTRSTVQVRDPSRAAPSLYIHEREEFANPAMPSRWRRVVVILGYLMLVGAAYLSVLAGLSLSGVISDACVMADRCRPSDNLVLTVAGGVWLLGCALCIGFGWRGKLYGARAA